MILISYIVQYALSEHAGEGGSQGQSLWDKYKSLDVNEIINDMFFEGQVYDAYSLLIDILNTATKNIIIIDNYIDKY